MVPRVPFIVYGPFMTPMVHFLRFRPLLLKVRPFMARLKLTFPSISDPFWPFLYFIWRPFFSIFLSLFWPFLYFIWRPFFSIFLSLFWPFMVRYRFIVHATYGEFIVPATLWPSRSVSASFMVGSITLAALYGLFLRRISGPFFVIYLRPSLWFRRGLFRVPGIWSSTCR
jgi:hypothetical protein